MTIFPARVASTVSAKRKDAIRYNVAVLTAIVDLANLGKTREEICAALRISQATYYCCRREIAKAAAQRRAVEDDA